MTDIIASVPVTTLVAGILTVVFLFLSGRVIGLRGSENVSLGTGDSAVLNRAVRAHGNCAEYAPLGILLLFLAEIQGAAPTLLLTASALLVIGRLMHGYALAISQHSPKFRFYGMFATLTALGILAISTLWIGVSTL